MVDYKTGELPDPATGAQIPVYIRAAEQITGLPAAGGAFHGVRTKDAKDRYLAEYTVASGKRKPNPQYARKLDEALAAVHAAVADIAAGRFNVAGDRTCSAARCPFRRICGYSEFRAMRKAKATVPADAAKGGGDD